MSFGATAQQIGLRTFAAMTENNTPAMPGDIDPRHVFLTTKEVIVRFGWGRTYGYLMLKSTGFPRPIGARYRLDTVMAWENKVLAGELTGKPDKEDVDAPESASCDQPGEAQQTDDAEPAGTGDSGPDADPGATSASEPDGSGDSGRDADPGATSASEPDGTGDDTPPVEAPRRRRTRGTGRAA